MNRKLAVAIVLASLVGRAHAEPTGEDDRPVNAADEPAGEAERPDLAPDEPTASDVAGAPRPGDESGRVDPPAHDSRLRAVGRGVLFVPKLVLETAFAPVRAGVWAYERYHLEERAIRLFFDESETYGLYPVARLESGYGVNAGARFVHRDLFGAREHLALHAATGGRFRHIVSARVRSGHRLGERVALQVEGQLEHRPKDEFYGIGNGDTIAMPVAGEPITSGVEARFRQRVARTALVGDLRLGGGFYVRASGVIADFEFEPNDDETSILELYPRETMLGWDGIRHGYTELELRYDTRRRMSTWEAPAVRAGGWLLAGFGGRVTALDGGADYGRYGVDLQHFFRLGAGPRVLAARLYGEGVTGTLDEVPFTQLPRLGGKTLLRGHPIDRFRDRVAAMGSLEYAWDLSRMVSASTFVDAGRVYASPGEIADDGLTGLRVGYGIALEAHTDQDFLLRATLSSSIDGGVFLDLAFDPVFDLDPRVERR